jgi:hypothetical protein
VPSHKHRALFDEYIQHPPITRAYIPTTASFQEEILPARQIIQKLKLLEGYQLKTRRTLAIARGDWDN